MTDWTGRPGELTDLFIQGHLFAQSLIGKFAISGKHLAGTGSHQSGTALAVSLLTKPKACLAFSAFEESQKPKKNPTFRRWTVLHTYSTENTCTVSS